MFDIIRASVSCLRVGSAGPGGTEGLCNSRTGSSTIRRYSSCSAIDSGDGAFGLRLASFLLFLYFMLDARVLSFLDLSEVVQSSCPAYSCIALFQSSAVKPTISSCGTGRGSGTVLCCESPLKYSSCTSSSSSSPLEYSSVSASVFVRVRP